MMWEKKLEKLASRAQAEECPRVNVASDVLGILTSGQAEPLTMAESLWIWLAAGASAVAVPVAENLWMWLAAGASAIAVPAAVVAVSIYNAGTGPLREIVNSVSWAM